MYDAVEIALMMQVSGRSVLGSLPWVDSCAASGADPFGDNPFDPGEGDDEPEDDDWF